MVSGSCGNPDAKRLYDDLLSNYNKLVRPVVNVTDAVTVKLKLKLSQLIDVNLRNQIMTTNLWVEQFWFDYKMRWDPAEYGGVDMLHVPSDHIWRPDIVLYNNADGNFEVTLSTKATLYNSGRVEWKPPAIYHSSCEMDVEYFPFDEQTCVMKFGSWTYDGFQVDLRHQEEECTNYKEHECTEYNPIVSIGVDLSEFYMSVEWDILAVPAIRNVKFYTCCDEPYLDITFNITMRRKTLFYTVNLIIPCMGISFLTVLVFYLPSDSGEKVSLSISILLSLTVFFLLLAEIIPPTSLVVPLLGKFVLFTMILDTFSICVTVVVLNVHFRSPQTHTMAPWVRRVFIHILPRLLVMRRPGNPDKQNPMMRKYQTQYIKENGFDDYVMEQAMLTSGHPGASKMIPGYLPPPPMPPLPGDDMDADIGYKSLPPLPAINGKVEYGGIAGSTCGSDEDYRNFNTCDLHGEIKYPPGSTECPEIYRALDGVRYIAETTKREEESCKVKEDWKYVAMVMDRLFLWIFTIAVLVGSAGIILQAPALYDTREAIDVELSEIEAATVKPLSERRGMKKASSMLV
jgi:nicotinic acetylcholine receptor